MKLEALPWIILFLPLLAAAVITLFTNRDRKLSAGLSIGAVMRAFILSVVFVATTGSARPRKHCLLASQLAHFRWISACASIRSSLLMLLIVTGVGEPDSYLFLGLHAGDPGFRATSVA